MTNWQPITRPWPASYNSRTDVNFLMTQDLDFLMTQDDNYLVLQDSYTINTSWIWRPTI